MALIAIYRPYTVGNLQRNETNQQHTLTGQEALRTDCAVQDQTLQDSAGQTRPAELQGQSIGKRLAEFILRGFQALEKSH